MFLIFLRFSWLRAGPNLLFFFRTLNRSISCFACSWTVDSSRWNCFLGNCLNWWIFLFGRNFFFWYHDPTSIVCFWYNVFISESKFGSDSTSPFLWKVIVAPVSTVEVIISFEPLSKLKIVLVFGFEELFNLL